MTTIRQPLSPDPADTFSLLYDALDATPFRTGDADAWLTTDAVIEIAQETEERAFEGALDPEAIEETIEVAEDESQRIFAYLLGLDRALMYAHPALGTSDQGALFEIALRYARTGRLSSDAVPGALLPRFSTRGRAGNFPDGPADAFASVVRVPDVVWAQAAHVVVPARYDLNRRDREDGIIVGCAPLLEDPTELSWAAQAGRYRLAVRGAEPMRAKLDSILEALDSSGATIGVLPELACSPELLEHWEALLRSSPPPEESKLRWLMVGTGPFEEDGAVFNRGFLLDRATATPLLTQDKMFRFAISADQMQDWRLEAFLGAGPLDEGISCGDRIALLESSLGRVAILICEDLARLEELAGTLVAHALSHGIAPVFSKETQPHHWEHSKAKTYADAAGTQMVVANSLVVARLTHDDGRVGTALAHGPDGHEVGWCERGTDVALLHLRAGTAPEVVGLA
jgi:predicted amidohydrolase